MRNLLLVFFTLFFLCANAQSYALYKDTINHFSIKIPIGWKYGLSKNSPTIKLIAYRTPSSPTDTSKHNFNINIVETPNSNLDKTYPQYLQSLKGGENFKLLDYGDVVINEKKYKWLIETHRYTSDKIQLHNYNFVTYHNEKTYIITFTTFSNSFELIKPTFVEVANSFILTN